jgi:hypothetical protein
MQKPPGGASVHEMSPVLRSFSRAQFTIQN